MKGLRWSLRDSGSGVLQPVQQHPNLSLQLDVFPPENGSGFLDATLLKPFGPNIHAAPSGSNFPLEAEQSHSHMMHSTTAGKNES